MANKEKLLEVADAAEASTFHDQHVWLDSHERDAKGEFEYPIDEIRLNHGACLTRACLAGHAALLYAPDGTTFDSATAWLNFADGHSEPIADWAARELGLNSVQEYAVFRCMGNQGAIARARYVAEHPDADMTEIIDAVPEYEV